MYDSTISDSDRVYHILSLTDENNQPYCVENSGNTTLIITLDGMTSFTEENSQSIDLVFYGVDDTLASSGKIVGNTIILNILDNPYTKQTYYLSNYFNPQINVFSYGLTGAKVVPSNPIISSEQIPTQKLSENKKYFTVRLASENIDAPAIYIKNNEVTTQINCVKGEDNIYCIPFVDQMESNVEYEVFYSNLCDKLINTNIKISLLEYTLTNIYFTDNYSSYISSEFNSITFTMEIAPSGQITSVEFIKDYDDTLIITFDNCPYVADSTIISCTNPSSEITQGTYIFKQINGPDSYIYSELESKELKFYVPPLEGQSQDTTQIIIPKNNYFLDKISSECILVPNIYVGNDETNIIPCTTEGQAEGVLKCTPNSTNMPSYGSYEIFYKHPSGDVLTTGITVISKEKNEITISNFNIKNGDKCTQSPFNGVSFTISDTPTGTLSNAVIELEGVSHTADCNRNELFVTCDFASDIEKEGVYTLLSISSSVEDIILLQKTMISILNMK